MLKSNDYRLFGVSLEKNKKLFVALQKVYGLGKNNVIPILTKLNIDPHQRVKDIDEKVLPDIANHVAQSNLPVEGDLKLKEISNIQSKIRKGCYQGKRHQAGLPVRGQRTKTNARTRKGRRKSVSKK